MGAAKAAQQAGKHMPISTDLYYDLWLAAVAAITRYDLKELSTFYSFEDAYERGLTPADAIRDCLGWNEYQTERLQANN